MSGDLADFVERLRVKSQRADFTCSPWSGVVREARTRRDIFHFTGTMNLLLYVVPESPDSEVARGVWELSKKKVVTLRSGLSKWWVVLLLRSADFGYLVPAEEVSRRIETGEWPPSPEGGYRVEEGLTLPKEYVYKSFDDLLRRISPCGLR